MKHTLLIIPVLLSIAAGAQTTVPAPYCLAPYNLHAADGGIIKVDIGTMSHASSIYAAPGYSYYNALTPPILYRDSAYTLSVTFDSCIHWDGTTDNSWYMVSIAFDTTGATFAGSYNFEAQGLTNATLLSVVKTFTVTVPHGAPLTNVRMRIVRYGTLSGVPHAENYCRFVSAINGNIGETKDYNLQIGDIPPVLSVATVGANPVIMYPNPTTGIVHIDGTAIITNVLGKVIYSGAGGAVDLSSSPSGIYYVRTGTAVSILRKD